MPDEDNGSSCLDQGDNDSPVTAADRLRQRIVRLGISQRAAARLIGVGEREMREWCAGKSPPPPFVLDSLDYGARQRAIQEQAIAEIEQQIGLLERPGTTIGYGAELGSKEAALREATRLRQRVEEHHALLRLEEAFSRRQAATFELIQHFDMDHGGDGVPTDDMLREVEEAEAEYQSAQTEVDRITQHIREGRR